MHPRIDTNLEREVGAELYFDNLCQVFLPNSPIYFISLGNHIEANFLYARIKILIFPHSKEIQKTIQLSEIVSYYYEQFRSWKHIILLTETTFNPIPLIFFLLLYMGQSTFETKFCFCNSSTLRVLHKMPETYGLS
jgi:hypothetical protein